MRSSKAHRETVLRHQARVQLMEQLRRSVEKIEREQRPSSKGARSERAVSWNAWVQEKTRRK